jgi:hypothetical protein
MKRSRRNHSIQSTFPKSLPQRRLSDNFMLGATMRDVRSSDLLFSGCVKCKHVVWQRHPSPPVLVVFPPCFPWDFFGDFFGGKQVETSWEPSNVPKINDYLENNLEVLRYLIKLTILNDLLLALWLRTNWFGVGYLVEFSHNLRSFAESRAVAWQFLLLAQKYHDENSPKSSIVAIGFYQNYLLSQWKLYSLFYFRRCFSTLREFIR